MRKVSVIGTTRCVAVSSSSVAKMVYSDDGINWTQVTLNPAGWSDICYGNGRFVAVNASYGISAYSDDGINWTENMNGIINNTWIIRKHI